MGRLKSKGNKAMIYPTNSIICQKLFGEVEDHSLTESKLSKQKVQSTRTLIFKI